MKDFTLDIYSKFLSELHSAGYEFSTFNDYILNDSSYGKIVIMRHDVDRLPKNALKMAELEHKMNIKASYYFRITNNSYDENIIREIISMGHEIGYHYEDLSISKGDYENAINSFKTNLDRFRNLYPVKTICMHGSPLSKYDNRLIWVKNNYKDFGIIGEPYYDINFQNVGYLTDTGRKWNSSSENIRDKVDTDFTFDFNSTYEIINAVKQNELPDTVMINIHPQRWHNNFLRWCVELTSQNIKNIIKRLINRFRFYEKSLN